MPSKRELELRIEELDMMNYKLKEMFNELHGELDWMIHELKMKKFDKQEKKKEIDKLEKKKEIDLEKKIGKLKEKIDKLYEGKRGWAFR